MSEIQKKMQEVKSLLDESLYLAEKVVKGNIPRPQYVDQNKKVEGKMEKLLQDVGSLVQTM